MTRRNLQHQLEDMPPLLRALLVERFAASPLAYHNLAHIEAMLDGLAVFAPGLSARDLRILRHAIWLHDAFYDVCAADNERRSADIGLALLQWPPDELADFETCVMATKGHRTGHPLAAILVDLDLAILAAPWDDYRAYALAIRDEYRLYPDDAYRAGRIRVLDDLCEGQMLRTLSTARGLEADTLERRAHANMRTEQARLRAGTGSIEAALNAGQ